MSVDGGTVRVGKSTHSVSFQKVFWNVGNRLGVHDRTSAATSFMVATTNELVGGLGGSSQGKRTQRFLLQFSLPQLAKTGFCAGFQQPKLRFREVHVLANLLPSLLIQVETRQNLTV